MKVRSLFKYTNLEIACNIGKMEQHVKMDDFPTNDRAVSTYKERAEAQSRAKSKQVLCIFSQRTPLNPSSITSKSLSLILDPPHGPVHERLSFALISYDRNNCSSILELKRMMHRSMFDKTTEALEDQDVFQWACHMGSVLENMPPKIFEDEGFDKRAWSRLELHLSSLTIALRILMDLSHGSLEVHLALEEGVRSHFVVHSKKCGIMVEVKMHPSDEREGIRQIESQEYFSEFEKFLNIHGFLAKLENWKSTSKWGVALNVYVNEEAKAIEVRPVVEKY